MRRRHRGIDDLVQFEQDFNTQTKLWDSIGWIVRLSQTRPILRSPEGDKNRKGDDVREWEKLI